MIHELAREYRKRLAAVAAERLSGFRAAKDMDDVRRRQGVLDGIDEAKSIFDDILKNWSGEES